MVFKKQNYKKKALAAYLPKDIFIYLNKKNKEYICKKVLKGNNEKSSYSSELLEFLPLINKNPEFWIKLLSRKSYIEEIVQSIISNDIGVFEYKYKKELNKIYPIIWDKLNQYSSIEYLTFLSKDENKNKNFTNFLVKNNNNPGFTMCLYDSVSFVNKLKDLGFVCDSKDLLKLKNWIQVILS